jgi:hypothetical protein
VVEDGWYPIHQALRVGQGGIDLVLFNPSTDEIRVVEVKTTTRPDASFKTSNTKHTGNQGSRKWVAQRLRDAGLENAKASDVTVRGAHVNARTGSVQWYDRLDTTGRRWGIAEKTPPSDTSTDSSPHPPQSPKGPTGTPPSQPPEAPNKTPPELPRREATTRATTAQRRVHPQAPVKESPSKPAPGPGPTPRAPTPSSGGVMPADRRVPAGDRRFA